MRNVRKAQRMRIGAQPYREEVHECRGLGPRSLGKRLIEGPAQLCGRGREFSALIVHASLAQA